MKSTNMSTHNEKLRQQRQQLLVLVCSPGFVGSLEPLRRCLKLEQLYVDECVWLEGDVDKVNANSQTPISIAAYKGRIEVVRFLVNKGADCTIEDKWGDAPLASATAQRHTAVVKLLS